MPNPQRRRSDRSPSTASHDTRQAQQWVQQCAARIVAIETELSLDEATEIARRMHGSERTGAMTPGAAAEFVADEMRRAGPARFERRGAARQPRA